MTPCHKGFPRKRGPASVRPLVFAATLGTASVLVLAPPAAADNISLNRNVVKMVHVLQYRAGCRTNLKVNPELQLAAQWHTIDVLNNRALDGDVGSDGSSPQDRATAAAYRGKASETVAINPALAISGTELIDQWYHNPAYMAIIQNCANSEIGVWSENSLDRTVVVAVYGQPEGTDTNSGGDDRVRAVYGPASGPSSSMKHRSSSASCRAGHNERRR